MISLLLAAGLAASSPTSTEKVEKEPVESVAAGICPQAYEISRLGGDAGAFVTRVGLIHGYTVEERTRLLQACVQYIRAQMGQR